MYYELWWAGSSLYIATKNKVYDNSIMEIRSTPVFKMYMDLDTLFARDPSDGSGVFNFNDFCSQVCKVISRVVMDCYPNGESDRNPRLFMVTMSVTAGATIKKRDENDNPVLWKRGIHLVWPELFVTREIAYQIVRAVCVRLQEKQGDDLLYRDVKRGENPWSLAGGVIDTSVYSSGLRLNGMPKADKCPDCFPKRQEWINRDFHPMFRDANFCPEHRACPGYLFRPETIYNVKKVYNGTKIMARAELGEYTKNYYFPPAKASLALMCLTGIRTAATEPTPGFQSHRVIASDARFITSEARQDEERYLGGKGPARKRAAEVPDRVRNKRELFPPADLLGRMQNILRKFGEGPYRQVVLDKVLAYKTSSTKSKTKIQRIGHSSSSSIVCEYDKIIFTLQGIGCHYCMKKGSTHTSNTAFFVLLPTCQVFQGCWSPNSHHGRVCRSYTTQKTTPPIVLDLNTNQADHEAAIEMLSMTME